MNKYVKIIICVLSCLSVGYLSGMVTQSSVTTWYPTLVKPSFNPPNWAFPIAWSLLFVMMGIAAGLVWSRLDYEQEQVRKGLKFFVIQLVLNCLWSFLFFGMKNPFLAMIEIVLLWLLIYETYVNFKKIDQFAGFLFIPYLLWVIFAGVLNANIWLLNK